MAGAVIFGGAVADQTLMSIVNDPAAVRSDARLGPFGKPAHIVASAAGLAIVAERSDAYAWTEVRRVRARRGALVIDTQQTRERADPKRNGELRRWVEKRTRVFRPLVDEVEESRLSATLAPVLDEMRVGRFSPHGTAWHDHLNAIDRLRGEFSDQDDDVLPVAAAGLWLSVGAMGMFVVAAFVNATAARAVPPGTFSLLHRVGPLDPRAVIAAFAFSALVTTLVLRIALGPQAVIWARGAARGWHHRGGRVRGTAIRLLGRLVLASSSSAAIVLLALLSFWPNIAATVLIDRQGIRNEVLLPFISLEQPWRSVTDIAQTGSAPREAVRFRFADGRELSTEGLALGGGTAPQLFDLSTAWREAAR